MAVLDAFAIPSLLALLGVFAIAFLALLPSPFLKRARRALDEGRPEEALALSRRALRWVKVTDSTAAEVRFVTWAALDRLGEDRAAAEEMRLVLRELEPDSTAPLDIANHAVNAFISAGAYSESLDIAARWSESAWFDGEEAFPSEAVLIPINQAEALYNLGRWEAAWRMLEDLDERASLDPVCRSGLRQQRAWILISWERSAEALELLTQEVFDGLPPDFRAEYHFTRGWALHGLGRDAEAWKSLEEGHACATRPTSRRNGLHLQARMAHARGRFDEAVRFCEDAQLCKPTGQGGDGLVCWGDALAALGRNDEARRAWHLALERDPESAAAVAAASRLAASG